MTIESASYAVGVSVTVHLPEELSRRVEEVAAARHLSPEQVAIEMIESHLPLPAGTDALEAFIGSGRSGQGDLARRHREILAEEFQEDASGRLSARARRRYRRLARRG